MAIQQTHDTNRGKEATSKRWTDQSMGQELDALMASSDSAMLQRVVADPRVASPADILALQHSFGNEAVSDLIQARLTVGAAGDQYEQEADRVAQQVMSVPAPSSRQQPAVADQFGVQRQETEEEEELQMKPLAASVTPWAQRQELEEEEELQTKRVASQLPVQRFVAQRQAPEEEEKLQLKAVQRQPPEEEEALMMRRVQRVGPEGGPVPEEARSAINRARGAGQPLEGPVQEQMSVGMGHDFGGVRVHADSEADALNRQLSAKAFTTGQDIFFRQGEYQPGSSSGRELIAHELSHVVQQSTGQVSSSGGMTVQPAGDALEREADRVAGEVGTVPSALPGRAPANEEHRQAVKGSSFKRSAYFPSALAREGRNGRHIQQDPEKDGTTGRMPGTHHRSRNTRSVQRVVVIREGDHEGRYSTIDKKTTEMLTYISLDYRSRATKMIESKREYAYMNFEVFKNTVAGGTTAPVYQKVTPKKILKWCWALSMLEGVRRAGLADQLVGAIQQKIETVREELGVPEWQRKVEKYMRDILGIQSSMAARGPMQPTPKSEPEDKSELVERFAKLIGPKWMGTRKHLNYASKVRDCAKGTSLSEDGIAISPDRNKVQFITATTSRLGAKETHEVLFIKLLGDKDAMVYNQQSGEDQPAKFFESGSKQAEGVRYIYSGNFYTLEFSE